MEQDILEFGPFRIDTHERVLLCGDEVLPLAPKAFDTLILLVRNPGRALEKEEMMRELWPDTFVEEANLAQHISLLRRTLGEVRGEPRYIETIPRRGYRFIGKVRIAGVPANEADGRAAEKRPAEASGLRGVVLQVTAGLALFGAGVAVSSLLVGSHPTRPLQFTPLVVDSTLKLSPAWSPNGLTVAYSGEVNGQLQIFTRTLGASMSTQITHHLNDCFLPFWSPDGQRIYFLANPSTEAVSFGVRRDLWSIGAAGGVPELLQQNVQAAAISPDGRTLALLRPSGGRYPGEVWLVSLPTGEPKKYARPPFDSIRYLTNGALRFSPDGSKLAVSVFLVEGRPEIWILPITAGAPYRALSSKPLAAAISDIDWMPDGRHVVLSDRFLASSNPQLFGADIDANRVWAMTGGTVAEQYPSVSPDGHRMAVAAMEGAYDLVEVSLYGAGIRSLGATARNELTPSLSPRASKTYAYATDRSGSYEIWLKNDGEGWERPVVTQKEFGSDRTGHLLDVTFSPDGQRIAYRRVGEKDESIWISTLVGDSPVRLVREPGGAFQRGPSWSPDGKWIAYYSTRNEKLAILKAQVGASVPPVLLRDDVGAYPRWSPDGAWLVCGTSGLWVVSADGTTRRSISDKQWMTRGWSQDGNRIYGIRADGSRRVVLAELEIRTGTERIFRDLGAYPVAFAFGSLTGMTPFRGYSLAPDGRSFITSIFRAQGDLWLIDGFDLSEPRWRSWFRAWR